MLYQQAREDRKARTWLCV